MARPKKGTKNIDGSWIFSDFSKGLYLLSTPRNIGEQLYSLAMISGRNCWSEKGALVPQNGYTINTTIPEQETITGYTKTDDGMNNIFIMTQSGTVYLYTAYEGLKEYKTKSSPASGVILTRRGKDLIYKVGSSCEMFGGYYTTSEEVEIISTSFTVDTDGYVAEIPLDAMKYFWGTKELHINGSQFNVISCVQELNKTTATLRVYRIDTTASLEPNTEYQIFEKCSIPLTFNYTPEDNSPNIGYITDLTNYSKYYGYSQKSKVATCSSNTVLLGADAKLYTSNGTITTSMTVSQTVPKTEPYVLASYNTKGGDGTCYTCTSLQFGGNKPTVGTSSSDRIGWFNNSTNTWNLVTSSNTQELKDRCVTPIAKYISSGQAETDQFVCTTAEIEASSIVPTMMACSQNRLFLLDITGRIYYSAIGVIDNFNQSDGAGYFEGFYQDYSQTLSIEDFLSGTLIVKQGGFYYLTISSSSTATGSAVFTTEIEKISNAGQEYATDHVIVGEKIFAFDTNTGAIVNAVATNVFGSLVSGKPIISSEYLSARSLGLNDTKRCLTYNAESEVFILYYGENLNQGLVLTNIGTLFPRQLDISCTGYIGFNQGVLFIGKYGEIGQDFIKGTIIPNLAPEVNFEAIGLRDNRLICSSILEITELNGIEYEVSTRNAGSSYQKIKPSINLSTDLTLLPPFLYSDYSNNIIYNSYSLDTQWANLKSSVTRISAPMSGREGVSISITFPKDTSFCLSALRLPDFSQGE